jgi:hypothetical protein
MNFRFTLAALATLAFAGCASQLGNPAGVRTYPASGPILGDSTFRLGPNTAIKLESLVNWGAYIGVAYLVLDPLAPNWNIEEAPMADDLVHFTLKMKRYYTGGAGEARSVLHHRAKELMQYNGFDAYQVVEYTESLESSILGSQRVAQGVIRMTRKN